MKTNEIREAIQKQKLEHKSHISNNPKCIFCNKQSEKPTVEFKRFWDWLQINDSALLVTGKSEELFSEVINLRRTTYKRSQEIKEKLEELLSYITYSSEVDLGKLVEETLDILDIRNNFRKTLTERLQERILKELDHFGSDIGSEVESEISIEENREIESEKSEEQSEKSTESLNNKLLKELNIKSEEIWNQELEKEMTKKDKKQNFSSSSYNRDNENDDEQDTIEISRPKELSNIE